MQSAAGRVGDATRKTSRRGASRLLITLGSEKEGLSVRILMHGTGC